MATPVIVTEEDLCTGNLLCYAVGADLPSLEMRMRARVVSDDLEGGPLLSKPSALLAGTTDA